MNMNSEPSIKGLQEILMKFQPIGLDRIADARLMDRCDRKFIVPCAKVGHLLNFLQDDYFILEVEGNRCSSYETLYFDTSSFDLYLMHHNGRSNRHKFRYRKYVDSALTFFEIKFKNNKKRTIKTRIPCSGIHENFPPEIESFIKEETAFNPQTLEPKVWVTYRRITLVNKKIEERITLDLELRISEGNNKVDFNPIVIVEAKQEKATRSRLIHCLRQMNIQEGSISKYCLAVSNLVPGIKANNFKKNIIQIHKLIHA